MLGAARHDVFAPVAVGLNVMHAPLQLQLVHSHVAIVPARSKQCVLCIVTYHASGMQTHLTVINTAATMRSLPDTENTTSPACQARQARHVPRDECTSSKTSSLVLTRMP